MLPHILSTLSAIRGAKRIRADIVVVGHVPLAQAVLGDGTCSLAAVLRGDVNKDEWRFLSSLDQSSPWSGYSQGIAPGELQKVVFQGQSAIGMLWARQNDSTIVSFAFPPNWANRSVHAELHQIDETGENLSSIGVEIPNLSRPEHVETHRELITTYGRNLAKSSLIYEGDGFVIRIWFNDHPPPHFHVMLRRDTSEAVARYPPLHIRVGVPEIERALSELGISDADDFHAKVCDCTVCKGVLAGDLKNLKQFGDLVLKVGNQKKSQTPDSAKKCRLHFILARRKEIDHVSELTAEELKQELKDTAAGYAALPGYLTLQAKARHLNTWAKIL
jgi:hypothetical protein